MANAKNDEMENLRRILERGLKIAQSPPMDSGYIDIFQHALDIWERANKPSQ